MGVDSIKNICPLYQNTNQTINEDLEYLFEQVSFRRADHPDIFKKTHYQISAYIDNRKYIENELFEMICPSNKMSHGSRCMIISGSTGIGKSELCAYFKNNLVEKGLEKYLLYLNKDASLYDIMTKELPAFFKKATGKEYTEIKSDAFDELKDPGIASGAIVHKMIKNIGRNLAEPFESSRNLRFAFQDFLEIGIKRIMKKDVESESSSLNVFDAQIVKKLSKENWMRTIQDKLREQNDEKIAKLLNEAFEKSIYEIAGVAPFSTQLKDIARKIGHRIWIVFEDFAIPDLDTDQIISFADSDQIEVDVQFIIALVPDRSAYAKLLGLTSSERAINVKFKEGDENFLNEETCLEFIKPFLKYHKENYSNYCEKCNRCSKEIIPLYPFNELFLERIFNGLDKHEQKPRKYVALVGSFLRGFQDGVFPFKNNHLLSEIRISGIPADLDQECQCLYHWYFISNDIHHIKEWCEAFNIHYQDPEPVKGKTPRRDEPIHSSPTTDPILEKLRDEVRNYLLNPDNPKFKNCGDTIKEGLMRVIEYLTDGNHLQGPWSSKKAPPILYHFPGRNNMLSTTSKKKVFSYIFNEYAIPEIVGRELLEIGYADQLSDDLNLNLSIDTIQFVIPIIENWRKTIIEYYWNQEFGDGDEDFFKLIEICYNIVKDTNNPFKNNIQVSYKNQSIIKDQNVQKLNQQLIKIQTCEKQVYDLLSCVKSIGGEIYKENQILNYNPWEEINNFQKPQVEKILDGNLRYKSSGPKIELTSMLKEIFLFARKLIEVSPYNKFEKSQLEKTINFLNEFNTDSLNNINQVSILSNLDRKPVKINLTNLSKIEFLKYRELQKQLKIIINEKNNGMKSLQALSLFHNELLFNLFEIISSETYLDLCNEKDLTLHQFCVKLDEKSKNKEKNDIRKIIKEEKILLQQILIKINLLSTHNEFNQNVSIKIDELTDLPEIQKINLKYQNEIDTYFKRQKTMIASLQELNKSLKNVDDDIFNDIFTSLSELQEETTKDHLLYYMDKKRNLQNKITSILPNIGSEKVLKLINGHSIPISNLNDDEFQDLLKSNLKDFISIIFKKT